MTQPWEQQWGPAHPCRSRAQQSPRQCGRCETQCRSSRRLFLGWQAPRFAVALCLRGPRQPRRRIDLAAADLASSFSESQFHRRALALRPDFHRACHDSREVLDCIGDPHVASACQDIFTAGSPRIALGAGGFFSHVESRSASTDAGWARRAARSQPPSSAALALDVRPASVRSSRPRTTSRIWGRLPLFGHTAACTAGSRRGTQRCRGAHSLQPDLRQSTLQSPADTAGTEELDRIGCTHADCASQVSFGLSASSDSPRCSSSDVGFRSSSPAAGRNGHAAYQQPSSPAAFPPRVAQRRPGTPRRRRGELQVHQRRRWMGPARGPLIATFFSIARSQPPRRGRPGLPPRTPR